MTPDRATAALTTSALATMMTMSSLKPLKASLGLTIPTATATDEVVAPSPPGEVAHHGDQETPAETEEADDRDAGPDGGKVEHIVGVTEQLLARETIMLGEVPTSVTMPPSRAPNDIGISNDEGEVLVWLGPSLTTIDRQIVALVGSVTLLCAFVKNIGALAMLMPIALG